MNTGRPVPCSTWSLTRGEGPVVAVALHAGRAVPADVEARMALGADDRRREEDPCTDEWARIAPNRLIVRRSRFEVDLNRPRETAVYRTPEDAWGLEVWKLPPSPELLASSRAIYDSFYAAAEQLLRGVVEREGAFVVLDLHSYNHRRGGPSAAPAPPADNPEINVGTGTLDRTAWGSLVDGFMNDLAACEVAGRPLDVRENVRFRGGHFARWVHETFPGTGCALAIEVKKTYMDEWTGEVDAKRTAQVGRALASTLPGLESSLRRRGRLARAT